MKNYFITNDTFHVYIDIDDTLAMWCYSEHDLQYTIIVGGPDFEQRVLPNLKTIEFIKQCKARNQKIIFWSAGGALWAEAVVKAFGLEKYADAILCKPNCYVDDLIAEDFMTNRVYFPLEKK